MSDTNDDNDGPSNPLESYVASTPESRELYEQACEYLPGGNTRHAVFNAPYPAYLAEGEGAHVTDVDGNTYLDFFNNASAMLHGYPPNEVVEAAVERVEGGSVLGGPTRAEVELAKHLCERAPAVEQIRFANSGTEATMNAIRAARAYTGNDVIAKFEGIYHGTHDDAQISVDPPGALAGPESDPRSVRESAGVPASTTDDVLTLPFDDVEAVRSKLDPNRDDLAGIIIAPLMGSMVIPASEEFVGFLEEYATEHDVPLIFDEVVSFRTSFGGVHERYGVEPDIVAFGKTIGGGFPVGAFGGRRELMDPFDPRGGADILHDGTFNANPVTAAAGLVALERYTESEVERLNELGRLLDRECQAIVEDVGVGIQFQQYGSLFKIYFTPEPVNGPRDAKASVGELEHRLFVTMLDAGIRVGPKLTGAISTPMDDAEVSQFATGLEQALEDLRPGIRREVPDLILD